VYLALPEEITVRCIMTSYNFISVILVFSSCLTLMFLNIFEIKYLPKQWLQGLFVPIHKKGRPSVVDNLRLQLVFVFSESN